MLTFTHTIIGGAIGAEVENPGLSFILGSLAHIITDKLPHFWPESKKGKTIVMVIDGLLTATTLILAYCLFPFQRSIFFGALGGTIVDVILVLTPAHKSKIGQWHTNRQDHRTGLLFLAADFVLILLSVAVIYLLMYKKF